MQRQKHMTLWHSCVVMLAAVLLMGGTVPSQAQATTERVNVTSSGEENDDYPRYNHYDHPCISADGRYVAFSSNSTILVPNSTSSFGKVFVKDRVTGSIECVSVSSTGVQGNGNSYYPSLSADGRYVAFISAANNLIPNDTNYWEDVFVHDRQTGVTECVSVTSSGVQANGYSVTVCISADGRYVAFTSWAGELVPGDTNGYEDAFVHDRQTGVTERVSVSSTGVQGNLVSFAVCISADGHYVGFVSSASNLVPNDTNNTEDVFVKDRVTGSIERVSVSSSGAQANGHNDATCISADGRYVAFGSSASNLVPNDTNRQTDIFVHDRQTGITGQVSVSTSGVQANGRSDATCISADGRVVAFRSFADNLVPNDTNGDGDVFVNNRQTGITERVSVSSTGVQGNAGNSYPSLSADGRFVVFYSSASNLVPNDTNEQGDFFVHGPLPTATSVVVAGFVTLPKLAPTAAPQPISFVFRSFGYPDEGRTASVGTDGVFSFSELPRRFYTLHIKGAKWLAANSSVLAYNGDVTNIQVTLRAGDANNDNFVDIEDLLLIMASYNQVAPNMGYSEAADFNADGVDNITDLLLLIANYNQQGDF